MSFAHPWMIGAGLAAVALPLLIHWLTRPRPIRLPLSTIRFIFQAVQQRRARHRLRDAIILLLRAAAILLIATALARPLLGRQAPAVSRSIGGTRLVLLDASQSMAAVWGGMQAFDRARPVVAQKLAYEPSLRCNLILGANRPRPAFDQPSTNFNALREELSRAAVRPETMDVQSSINRCADMLAKSPAGPGQRRELVIVSDFQRSNWASSDFSVLPRDAVIRLESIAPAEPPPNLAIVRASARGRAEQSRELRVEVEVANFSPAARPIPVEILIGGDAYRVEGNCPARGRVTLTADITPRQTGWQTGEARLVGVEDALAADNTRPFVIDVRPAPVYALVSRQSGKPQAASSYYLERALAPIGARERQGADRVIRVDPNVLDREVLAPAELIVLDHPGKLSPEWVQWIAGSLRRGRPVLYFAAESPDATNLKLLSDAAGSDLKMPVEFVPPPAGLARRDLFLQEINGKVAPFSVFGDGLAAVKSSLRFSGGLGSRRLEGGLPDDVLAEFSDRSAALIVTPCGAGMLAVLNADLGASNLPSSAAFVPLVGELIDRLAGERRRDQAAVCGEATTAYLPPDAGPSTGLTVVGPGGAAVSPGVFADESAGTLWSWLPSLPGVYQVQRDGKTVFAMAAAVPQAEADLLAMEPSLFTGRLAGGRDIQYRSAAMDEQKKDNTWAWLAVACAGCLLAETATLKLFRT